LLFTNAFCEDEEKPYWVRTDVSGDVGTSRMLLLHSIPAALGAEIIGPISREDKKAFELSQLMQNEYLVALFPLAGGEVSQRGVVATEGTLRPSGRYTGGVPQFNVPRYSQRTLKISIYFAYFLFLLCGARLLYRLLLPIRPARAAALIKKSRACSVLKLSFFHRSGFRSNSPPSLLQ